MSELMNPRAGVSRRKFLRLWASSVGALAVLGVETPSAFAGGEAAAGATDRTEAVLIDVSRCVGCGNCQRGCGQANDLHPALDELNALGPQTYTIVDRKQLSSGESRTVKRACMHCLHPACVTACTVGAMTRNADGAVVVDTGKCIGCRYCQYACPFGVPQFQWEKTLGVVSKCTSCVSRLAEGEVPACTAACPSGALRFGQRGDLLKRAHARLAAHPEYYVNYVYGENEVGGTSRLYISDVSFEQLGLPKLGPTPAPQYAEQVMTRTPVIALSVAAVCTGLYSFLGRRGKHIEISANREEEKER